MVSILAETTLNIELREAIGSGGEGEVFIGFDPQLNAEIAVKRIPIAKFRDPELYFEESKKLYLTNHHNVVKINYACQDEGFIYLSMPLYKNGSLKSIIDQRSLTAREIIRYSLQFLSGLNNVHSKHLIHFDIKPENILLSDSDKALLSDFGLAQYTGSYGFAKVYGTTLPYAPPELFLHEAHNLKFDIYQAGLTLYRLCNGDQHLFSQFASVMNGEGQIQQVLLQGRIIKGKFPNRVFFLPHIPKQLRKIVVKALKPNPDERYSSVIEFLNDLNRIKIFGDWTYIPRELSEEWVMEGRSVKSSFAKGKFNIITVKNGRRKHEYCTIIDTEKAKNDFLYDCLNTEW